MRWRFGLGTTALLLGLSALTPSCARRAADESMTPTVAPAPATPGAATDLDQLERELTESERRLSLYLPDRTRESRVQSSERAAPVEEAEEAPRDSSARLPAKASSDKKEAPRRGEASGAAAPAAAAPPSPEPESDAGNDCELACRAFASMRRAADRICAIAGEADARCERARQRVEEAEQRITQARCTCSEE
jgi:hypothetical protein